MALEKNQAKTKQHVKYTKYKMCLSMVIIIIIINDLFQFGL